jgi:hypothetical protein
MKKRRKLKKKKKEKSGWLEPPLAQKMGWPDHPIFGQGVAGHPIPAVWGWLQAFGSGPATPKSQKKKRKKMGLGFWGWPDHPLGPGGGFGHHLTVVGGGQSHPQALGGGPATPKIPNPFFSFFFFFLGPFGVAGPPPKAWGGFGHPHTAGMGWPATPISPFFFFFFFNFLLFFH